MSRKPLIPKRFQISSRPPAGNCQRTARPSRRALGVLSVLLSLLCASATAGTLPAEVHDKLARDGQVEVLIRASAPSARPVAMADADFVARVTAAASQLRRHSAANQSALLARLSALGVVHRHYWLVDAVWARLDAGQLEQVARLPGVGEIILDARLPMRLPPPVPTHAKAARAVEWGVQRIGAPAAWARGHFGQGVVIAGQDTGYEWSHPALRNSYRGWNNGSANHDYHWRDAVHALIGGGSNPCGVNAPAPCDDHNHGTHTMGTMVGDDGAGNQIGIAPQARWIACRNMERGNGTVAMYLECMQWFLAPTDLAGNNPDPGKAPHIINNSWGCPPSEGCTDVGILRDAVDALRAAGILMVVSAGNSGPNCSSIDTAPAPYASSFSVAASQNNDAIAAFSSRGPGNDGGVLRMKPDITAPGVGIRSSIRGGGYGNSSGTSMAGPHVAGAAALLMSADPRLKGHPDRVEALLRSTARPLTSAQSCGAFPGNLIPNAVFGHGLLDVEAALDRLLPLFRDGFEAEPSARKQAHGVSASKGPAAAS